MGFSNGGNVTLRVGLRHPARVNKLVAVSAMYRHDGMVPGFWDGFKNPDISMMPEPLKAADRKINPDPKHLQQLFDQDVKRMATFQDWPDADLTGIAAPTLVVVGDYDVVLPEHATKMSRLLPRGRLMIVPGEHGDFLGDCMSQRPDSQVPAAVVRPSRRFWTSDPARIATDEEGADARHRAAGRLATARPAAGDMTFLSRRRKAG
jgi:hypothetical protein